jgi:hypothetical protein
VQHAACSTECKATPYNRTAEHGGCHCDAGAEREYAHEPKRAGDKHAHQDRSEEAQGRVRQGVTPGRLRSVHGVQPLHTAGPVSQ